MNNKFDEKCKALYEYEEEMCDRLTDLILPFNNELAKLGCKVECKLVWFYLDEVKNDYDFSLKRTSIIYKQPYKCLLSVSFGEDGYDFVGAESEARGFVITEVVSSYCLSLWRGWSFNRGKCKYIFKQAVELFNKIKEVGLEETINTVLNNPKAKKV